MRLRPLVAALAAGMLLAACGSDGGDASGATDAASATTDAASGTTEASSATTEAAAVDATFDFVAPDVRGGEVFGADYAGRDLVIWFWAPW